MPAKKPRRGVNAEKWDTHTFLTEKRPDWKKRFERACKARGTTPSEHLRLLVKATVQRFERLDPFGARGPRG